MKKCCILILGMLLISVCSFSIPEERLIELLKKYPGAQVENTPIFGPEVNPKGTPYFLAGKLVSQIDGGFVFRYQDQSKGLNAEFVIENPEFNFNDLILNNFYVCVGYYRRNFEGRNVLGGRVVVPILSNVTTYAENRIDFEMTSLRYLISIGAVFTHIQVKPFPKVTVPEVVEDSVEQEEPEEIDGE
jgi:hypothetical protein